MSSSRYLMTTLLLSGALVVGGCATEPETTVEPAPPHGNIITGEGLPNPTATVIENWGDLPEGREWGSTAGLDIDQTDGHVWGYERCGSGSAGGPGVNCDNNPVDPIFKFARDTGAVSYTHLTLPPSDLV